jgi:putative membrane protein
MKGKRGKKECAYLFLTGFLMGSADVVPGVSGGTIAFIMGIYLELLNTIKLFNLKLLRMVCKFQLKEILNYLPWKFIGFLGAGILFAIASLVHLISWALEYHETYLLSLFFGLVTASILIVLKELKPKFGVFVSVLIGSVFAWWLVGLPPSESSHTPVILFLSGMIAITAMILPGISGSFILLILGQYAYVIKAVKELEFFTIAMVAAGCLVGLTSFSRILSWLLDRHYQVTVGLLVGFMIGSLRKIWPFKNELSSMTKPNGKSISTSFENTMPDLSNSTWWICLIIAIFGVALILSLHRLRESFSAESG